MTQDFFPRKEERSLNVIKVKSTYFQCDSSYLRESNRILLNSRNIESLQVNSACALNCLGLLCISCVLVSSLDFFLVLPYLTKEISLYYSSLDFWQYPQMPEVNQQDLSSATASNLSFKVEMRTGVVAQQ